jgi:hypothetical protein
MMFLDSEGKLTRKLNAFEDFSTTHGDGRSLTAPNVDVFLRALEKHFPEE